MQPKEQNVNNLTHLDQIAALDVQGLRKAAESYGDSWKRRGGANAYFMLVRKIDRMENQCEKFHYDIFEAISADRRAEGLIDDIRDLRRYLMLVESEMIERGIIKMDNHRDNK